MITKIFIHDEDGRFRAEVHGDPKRITAIIIELAERDSVFRKSILMASKFIEHLPFEVKSQKPIIEGNELINLINNLGKQ